MFKKWTRTVSVAATLFVLLCSAGLTQEGESVLTRKIERQGEEFVVQVSKDQTKAMVTGQHGVEVTIRPGLRQFQRTAAERLGRLAADKGRSCRVCRYALRRGEKPADSR